MDLQSQSPLIEIRNVSVSKHGKLILDSLNLRIEIGENVAIIGPNGSGKSSLIRLITGEYHPLSSKADSSLRIAGRDRWNLFELRSLLGIVSDDLENEYMRSIKGIDVVISGFFSSIGLYQNHVVLPEMRKKSYEILDLLDIGHLALRNFTELSAGEARRLLIARALVHDPQALVLDEPTNSLDMKAKHKFRMTLKKIASKGKNIILVTHSLEDLIPEINRVILLKDGMIFFDGTNKEALTSEKLSEVFGISINVSSSDGYFHAWC
ncbi:ATP-binding cassette domain-containing protein [Methanohalophilus sp.]|uniref:ABC transporter ATP-binding protein n=1 Tax=Methanohalophilus sp. TaxID=1966352 RepID=UPI002617D75E|nr:ATP-binding cassette domain-containing protein [Methanohalophilus sp.]MDK2892011.1 iron complex transport system ATP-binding protein [Methanohalophilus sp.]